MWVGREGGGSLPPSRKWGSPLQNTMVANSLAPPDGYLLDFIDGDAGTLTLDEMNTAVMQLCVSDIARAGMVEIMRQLDAIM